MINKIVNIGKSRDGEIFCKIELTQEGRLSISGVIGPLKNGNCKGSCGQIDTSIKQYASEAGIEYATGWSRPLLEDFLTAWDCWHLNDMRPYCEHQGHLNRIARDKVYIYQWRLKPDISKKKRELEEEAIERAKSVDENRSLGFYAQDRKILQLEQFIKTHDAELTGDLARYYEPTSDEYGYFAHKTEKTLGWLSVDEHPAGLLGRVCDKCGYAYGSAWKFEELPKSIIELLEQLPESTKKPAWV